MLGAGKIDVVIDIPYKQGNVALSGGYRIRRGAVDFGAFLVTNTQLAMAIIRALSEIKEIPCMSMTEIYSLGEATASFSKPTETLFRLEAKHHSKTSEDDETPLLYSR